MEAFGKAVGKELNSRVDLITIPLNLLLIIDDAEAIDDRLASAG